MGYSAFISTQKRKAKDILMSYMRMKGIKCRGALQVSIFHAAPDTAIAQVYITVQSISKHLNQLN